MKKWIEVKPFQKLKIWWLRLNIQIEVICCPFSAYQNKSGKSDGSRVRTFERSGAESHHDGYGYRVYPQCGTHYPRTSTSVGTWSDFLFSRNEDIIWSPKFSENRKITDYSPYSGSLRFCSYFIYLNTFLNFGHSSRNTSAWPPLKRGFSPKWG